MTEIKNDELNTVDEQKAESLKKDIRWYVIHTYSGYENKVKENIEAAVIRRNMSDIIEEVVVPMHKVEETKNGERKVVEKKVFPGYVLVKMYMTDDAWYIVRNTKGVTGFVGPGSKPVPLSDEEVKAMGIEIDVPKVVNPDVDLEIGDAVEVAKGPFSGQVGTVEEINLETREAKVCIDAFGKKTLFVIEFENIQKI